MNEKAMKWLMTLAMMLGLAACSENDNPVQQQTKATLFVATDRHEAGGGNNLTAMLQRAVDASGVRPGTVLLGGDYVGGKGDMTPVFSIDDLYSEIYAVVDPLSAESATRHFTEWVSTLADHDPIVVMTHVPMHANRGDNPGGIVWYEALSQAAKHHDIIVLWGHNHTLEERGNDKDQYAYLLTNGDSLSVQGDSLVGVVRKPLNFTYANAGYLKLGHCSVITFSGNNGIYQQMEIRRYSLDPADNEKEFGLTGKPNPYIIQLRRK